MPRGLAVAVVGIALLGDAVLAQSRPVLACLPHPRSTDVRLVAAGDLDEDGHVDLVTHGLAPVGSGAADELVIAWGEGGGAFSATTVVATTTAVVRGLSVLDADGDDDLDIVLLGAATHLNDGDGAFATVMPSPAAFVPPYPYARPAVADLNGDGAADLCFAATSVNGLLSRGDGSYDVFTLAADDGTSLHDVALGDVDEDGAVDMVAVGDAIETSVFLRRGDGAGGFGADELLVTDGGSGLQDLALGDVDRDGHLDLVRLRRPSLSHDQLVVNVGRGDGTFGADIDGASAPGGGPFLLLADIDADGDLDGVGFDTHPSVPPVAISLNDGAGSFGPPTRHLVAAHLRDAVVVDVDADGRDDLAFATRDDGLLVCTSRATSFAPVPLSGSIRQLAGSGAPEPDGRVEIALSGAPGSGLVVASCTAILASVGPLPLVPAVDVLIPVTTGQPLVLRWPRGVPRGLSTYWQAWITQGAAPAASDALIIVSR